MKRYLQKVVYCTDRKLCDAVERGDIDAERDMNSASVTGVASDMDSVSVTGVAGDMNLTCDTGTACDVDSVCSTGASCRMDLRWAARLEKEGVLYITDNEKYLRILQDNNLPAAAWIHEFNRDQNLSAAFYAVESPEELDMDFFEKIYRREKGIPWEILETERCLVREMVPEDAESFEEMYRDPAISRYLRDFHKDKEGEAAYIREYQQQYRFFEYGVWSIVLKATGEVIGRVGFSQIPAGCEAASRSDEQDGPQCNIWNNVWSDEQDETQCNTWNNARNEVQSASGNEEPEVPQFGYMIGVPWQGQGLAYEVCRAILSYAGEELGFEKIALWTEESNEASRKLSRKLGFSEEKIVSRMGWCCYEYYCK